MLKDTIGHLHQAKSFIKTLSESDDRDDDLEIEAPRITEKPNVVSVPPGVAPEEDYMSMVNK